MGEGDRCREESLFIVEVNTEKERGIMETMEFFILIKATKNKQTNSVDDINTEIRRQLGEGKTILLNPRYFSLCRSVGSDLGVWVRFSLVSNGGDKSHFHSIYSRVCWTGERRDPKHLKRLKGRRPGDATPSSAAGI